MFWVFGGVWNGTCVQLTGEVLNTRTPRVSVILTTYNRAELVGRAIQSVLDQTLRDFELIVVDDASEDDTADIIEGFDDPRITYIRHDENRGGAAARNTGIKEASGEYIAFLDSDDKWLEDKLEKQVEALRNRPDNWGAIYCLHYNESGEVIGTTHEGVFIYEILAEKAKTGGSSSFLLRREVIDEVGLWDESFDRHQDYEYIIRVMKEFEVGVLEEPLFVRFQTPNPPGKKEERAKQKLWSKFQSEIDEFTYREKFKVWSSGYLRLSGLFIEEENALRGLSYLFRALLFFPFCNKKKLILNVLLALEHFVGIPLLSWTK